MVNINKPPPANVKDCLTHDTRVSKLCDMYLVSWFVDNVTTTTLACS